MLELLGLFGILLVGIGAFGLAYIAARLANCGCFAIVILLILIGAVALR
jgi:hypothetical protein